MLVNARHGLKYFTLFLCSILIVINYRVDLAYAAPLTSMSDTLSNTTATQSGVTHTLAFTTASTSGIKQIDFQFSTTGGGSTKPAGLSLTGTTLGTVSNLGSGWSLNTGSAGTGKLVINRASADNVNASVAASVEIQGITNSAINDCESTDIDLTDTCYVTVTTYSDDGSTSVDSGTTTYLVHEDPVLSFSVVSVGASETHNGVTTSIASTSTSIPFGRLTGNQVRYIGQKLHISTNAPHGYTVNAYLAENINGTYGGSTISPFGATNATWSTPQLWSTPTGTTANSDSGWFGANTSDTRVSGWSSASAKFGPISSIPHAVAYSTGPDPSGTDVYVTYALGINSIQPSDIYSGKIVYDIQASY